MSRCAATAPLLVVLSMTACPGSTEVDLCAGVTCAPGRTCVNGACLPGQGCTSHADCAPGQLCNGGTCSYPGADLGTYDVGPDPDTPGPGAEAGAEAGIQDGPASPDGPLPPDAPLPPDQAADVDPGHWYQANAQNCPSHCAKLGRVNVASSEGAYCMSGEVRPKSGIDQGITFTYKCWPSCTPQAPPIKATSSGVYCYRAGQKQDNDGTDLTVGCFCK